MADFKANGEESMSLKTDGTLPQVFLFCKRWRISGRSSPVFISGNRPLYSCLRNLYGLLLDGQIRDLGKRNAGFLTPVISDNYKVISVGTATGNA